MAKLKLEQGGMAGTQEKVPDVDIKRTRICVYFGTNVGLLKRLVELSMRHRGVSVAGLIVTCCEACIDTLEADMPTKRVFKLNGRNVEI